MLRHIRIPTRRNREIAEFEHALMSERTRDGLAAARARGRTGAQGPKLGPGQAGLAREMLKKKTPTGNDVALRCLLTAAERSTVLAVPTGDEDLAAHYTLSDTDMSLIRQRRGDANRLGF